MHKCQGIRFRSIGSQGCQHPLRLASAVVAQAHFFIPKSTAHRIPLYYVDMIRTAFLYSTKTSDGAVHVLQTMKGFT